jgi:hypothetical protein
MVAALSKLRSILSQFPPIALEHSSPSHSTENVWLQLVEFFESGKLSGEISDEELPWLVEYLDAHLEKLPPIFRKPDEDWLLEVADGSSVPLLRLARGLKEHFQPSFLQTLFQLLTTSVEVQDFITVMSEAIERWMACEYLNWESAEEKAEVLLRMVEEKGNFFNKAVYNSDTMDSFVWKLLPPESSQEECKAIILEDLADIRRSQRSYDFLKPHSFTVDNWRRELERWLRRLDEDRQPLYIYNYLRPKERHALYELALLWERVLTEVQGKRPESFETFLYIFSMLDTHHSLNIAGMVVPGETKTVLMFKWWIA